MASWSTRWWPSWLFVAAAVAAAAAVALGIVAATGVLTLAARPPAGSAPHTVVRAQRIALDGAVTDVTLPDEHVASDADAAVMVRYRFKVDLGRSDGRLALYIPGLLARCALRVNGRTVFDELQPPLATRRRGAAAAVVFDLPEALLVQGSNQFDLQVVGRGWTSLSSLQLGHSDALHDEQQAKWHAMVTGPLLVAAVVGLLGSSALLVWARRRAEVQYGYFGTGAVLWALHTCWTVSPHGLLAGIHLGVAWTSLYAAWVVLLSLFALRFAEASPRWLERTLLGALVVTPIALYGAAWLSALGPAAEAVRLVLVVLAFWSLGVVARHAGRHRSVASALFVVVGVASAGLGLRDWLVFHDGSDNNPVQLTPYAGLPFVVLVGWILIDRFVRTADSWEALGRELEQRVALREQELESSFERLAGLARDQAASDERQVVLRELHDGLGARLVNALTRVEGDGAQSNGVAQVLRDCLADMRLAIEVLGSPQARLSDVLGSMLFRWSESFAAAGVQTDWQVGATATDGESLSPREVLHVARIVQEALNNVLRHAAARTVRLQLTRGPHGLELAVEDDGCGFDATAQTRGRGLFDMRARATALGARHVVDSAPGAGTRLRLQLPLPESSAALA